MPSMSNRSRFGRLVRWLAGRSSAALVGMSLVWFVSWSWLIYLLLEELVSGPRQEDLASVAGS